MSEPLRPHLNICKKGGGGCYWELKADTEKASQWICTKCKNITMVEKPPEGLTPYRLLRVNDGDPMIQSQCEGCQYYEMSRPECKIMQRYFRGEYPPGVPKEWFRDKEGNPFCQSRKKARKQIAALDVYKDETLEEEPEEITPSPEHVRLVLYHDESESLVIVDSHEEMEKLQPGAGGNLVEIRPGEIYPYLKDTVYSYE